METKTTSYQTKTGPKPFKSSSPKLRASCDGCSLAKVKCDKKQPICQRCGNSGIVCHYSPSMRMGKTSAASRAAGVKAMNGDLRSKITTASPSRISSPSSTSSTSSSTPNSGFLDPNFISPSYLHTPEFKDLLGKPCQAPTPLEHMNTTFLNDWSRYSRDFYDESVFVHPTDVLVSASLGPSDPSTHPESSVDTPYSITAMADPSLMPADEPHLLFSDSHIGGATFHPHSPVNHLSLSPSGSSKIQEHDCMRTAKSTLNTLTLLSTQGTTASTYSSLPTIDQALTTNTKAVKILFDILSCHCSHDPYLPFLFTVISSKVLGWYQAIACANTSAALGSGSPFAGREMAVHIPLSLGAYRLDGEYEEKMKIQLVLNELRKVEVLVDKYKERFCSGGDEACSADTGVYSALDTFLRKRLKETVEELRSEENYQMTTA